MGGGGGGGGGGGFRVHEGAFVDQKPPVEHAKPAEPVAPGLAFSFGGY